MRTRVIWLSVGFVLLVGVLFIWLRGSEPERKPTAAATPPVSLVPIVSPSPVPTRDPALLPASFYTVDEVWKQAQALAGQRIAVRGLAGYYLTTEDTVPYCDHDCGCMRSAELEFLLRGSEHVLAISLPHCQCDKVRCCEDWAIQCRPFDPHAGEAYEMVGELRVFHEDEVITQLVLHMEYEDAKVSSQLVGEGPLAEQNRLPLVLETALFPKDDIPVSMIMPTPTPRPDPPAYYGYMTDDVATLDPQLAQDAAALDFVENLFVQLTNFDAATGEIVPEAAASWQINPNATVYTLTLRTDIPWVHHAPSVPGTRQVFDEAGQPRFVTAQDFVYGIRRLCDPANQTTTAVELIVPLLQGCAAARAYPSLAEIPPEVWLTIGVRALDERTLVIELTEPAAQFLAMTTLGAMSAVPQWLLEDEEWGRYWIEAGTIVTNGRFVLGEWVHYMHIRLERNSLFPDDLAGSGNIEQVLILVVPDVVTGYSLWLNGQVDLTTIPLEEITNQIANYPEQTQLVPDGTVYYFAFDTTLPPFDDVRVRRAFSMALDRSLLTRSLLGGVGLPLTLFALPGQPPIERIAEVGYAPDDARAQLAAAGYPDCEDFPALHVSSWSGKLKTSLAPLALAQWSTVLGCQVETWQTHACGASSLGTAPCDAIPGGYAHLRLNRWIPTYADVQNVVDGLFACMPDSESPYYRQVCQPVDDWIAAARATPDPSQRQALYRQIESALFGSEGEFPILPLFAGSMYIARQEWLIYTANPYGAQQWYNWSVDPEKQSIGRY